MLFVFIGVKVVLNALADDVISEQSLEVDTVSGATVSSICIMKAVENALQVEN